MPPSANISKKRKFVADGVFYAELNEFLNRELAEDGYAGVEVRATPIRTEIIIRATRTQNVLGDKGRRIRELTSVVQKRFAFPEGGVELYAERVADKGLCAQAQAESLKYKLIGGLACRRACYGVLRFVMESGAKGAEVVVSGKLRGQRAKAMKFAQGYMIKTGFAVQEYIDSAVRHVLMRQGVLGIKVSIMLPHDPEGKRGPKTPLSDIIKIIEPKEDEVIAGKTWDQRSRVRADELSALTSATTIIKTGVSENTSANAVRFAQQGVRVKMASENAHNPEIMEAFEAEAEAAEGSPSFLQKRMVKAKSLLVALSRHSSADPDAAKNAVMDLLHSQGTKLHSTLLIGLANQIKADPFAKVKKLIQDLIERLLQEAADEANQKGWCDKATADAEQKRTYAVEKVAELNSQSAELEATIAKLSEALEVLGVEIPELEQKQEDATAMRKEEKSENQATVMEAEAGLEAVNEAIDILDKFYKTAAKESVDLGLVQKGPLDDAPDSGFDNGEAYTGAGGESGGILGMLDVIKSDFERTISTTNKAEATNEKEYQKFMTESGKSLAEKKMAEEQKTNQKDDAITELESADEDLRSQTDILKVSIRELLELKPTCVDTGMSYEERVARREDEIESLKKALCVLESQEEFGPEGGGASC